jgi:hypothetical protein
MKDIVCYFHPTWGWVVYALDEHCNQLWDAQYYPNKKMLKKAFDALPIL